MTHVANYHISSNKRLGAYLKFCLEGGGVEEGHFNTVKGQRLLRNFSDPTEVKTYKVLNKVAVEAGFFPCIPVIKKVREKGGNIYLASGGGCLSGKGPLLESGCLIKEIW